MNVSDVDMAALLASVAPPGVDSITRAVQTLAPLNPELLCRVCEKPLDLSHADLSTHADCEPELPDVGRPPSTMNELERILTEYDRNSPRSRQVAIGPSDIATACDRRLGYKLRNMPEHVGEFKWAAMIGTAVHSLIARALDEENRRLGRERWLIEHRVHPDPSIGGSCDAYDLDTDTVVDWKVVGPTQIQNYQPGPRTPHRGPPLSYVQQINMYGRGWQRAGRNPRWVRIVFLARTTKFSDGFEWTAPYSRRVADAALDRMFRLSTLLTDLGVDAQPDLWSVIPAMPDRLCQYCPYFRRDQSDRPADETGCPGDVATYARSVQTATKGLIAP